MILALTLLAAIPSAWFGVLIPPGKAPVVHYTDLTWNAGAGNPSDTGYNVYKAPGACATAAEWHQIATGVSSGPAGLGYRDYAVTAGATACYYVTSVYAGQESSPSEKVDATTPTDFKVGTTLRRPQWQ